MYSTTGIGTDTGTGTDAGIDTVHSLMNSWPDENRSN